MEFFHPFMPEVLEVYCGPMKSGKTRDLINRVDQLDQLPQNAMFFKPSTDTRNTVIHSRYFNGTKEIPCKLVDKEKPSEIRDYLDEIDVVVIDEAQFFTNDLVKVVEGLLRIKKNVIIGGLDLDFRGEPFGPMPYLMAKANMVRKLRGVCEYKTNIKIRCNNSSTRTQRLISGEPAKYDSPIVAVEGTGIENYETRCLEHHFVPRN